MSKRMGKVDVRISGINPDTNEGVVHAKEVDAVCAVQLNSDGEKVEVVSSIMGSLNAATACHMIDGLVKVAKQLLDDLPPGLAAHFLAEKLGILGCDCKNCEEECENNESSGESCSPEQPDEQ